MLVILFLIDVMLGWSLYFSNASITESVKSSTDGFLIEGLSGSDKFLAMVQKYLLNVSTISSSLDKVTSLSIEFLYVKICNFNLVSIWFILSEKRGFTVCQNFFYYQQYCWFLYSHNIPS